jgi:hypothetical protein
MSDYVIVPRSSEMSDETFQKHYAARHLEDIGMTDMRPHPDGSGAISPLRAYHDRCHTDWDPDYDHVHE